MSDLWKLPASAIAALVRAREVSAREAVESTLGRMAAVNPALNAVVAEFPDEALAAAGVVDAAIREGRDPGPLAGVPVTVKINIDLAGHATTNGLKLQKDLVAASDSPVVTNLRRAGAVVIGQTNTPAFSLRWFTRNSLHGATKNPHDAGLTPGGSSGGAGAAVAAGIGAIAHGTDIAGSIRYPAYACGVHGIRPTLGRVAAVNLSGPDRSIGAQLMAVSGPLARRIEDLRLALSAMSAPSTLDPWWMPVPLSGPSVPKRVALCLAPDGMATDPQVVHALRQAAATLEAAGWTVEEVEPPSFRRAAEVNMALWMADFRMGALHKVEEEADPDALIVVERLMAIAGECADAMTALQQRLGLIRAWQAFLEDWPLVLCPVSAEPPFPDLLDIEGPEAFARIAEAQLTQAAVPALGLPGLTVATGAPGSPMGVQLIAGRFREDVLFEAGAAIEAAHPAIGPVDPFAAG